MVKSVVIEREREEGSSGKGHSRDERERMGVMVRGAVGLRETEGKRVWEE